MEIMTPNLTLIVATRNRPKQVVNLLNSLLAIHSEFERVILVDSSDGRALLENISTVEQVRAAGLDVDYIQSKLRSLTHQKNLALELCREKSVIQILDDDVIPAPGYLTKSYDLLMAREATGVSGITTDLSRESLIRKIFGVIFGLSSFKGGAVSDSGLGVPVLYDALTETDWLIGCSMWNLEKLGPQKYFEEFPGSALFEDVEFSLRAKLKGDLLLVDPSLVLLHESAEENRPDPFTYWYRFSRNRMEILRLKSRWAKAQLLRGNVGAFIQILLGTEPRKVDALRGLLSGTLAALRGGQFL